MSCSGWCLTPGHDVAASILGMLLVMAGRLTEAEPFVDQAARAGEHRAALE